MMASEAEGRFITFEGGEGSGKSTQIRRLATWMRKTATEVIETREPGGSPMGERIRGLLLDPEAKLDPVTQALLFSAARRDHVVNLIQPALARGAHVLCDRFADSTRAYQQAAGSVTEDLVETITRAAVGSTTPHLTVILDIDPAEGLARAHSRRNADARADAFEAADLGFHFRVRQGYLAIAAREPARCRIVDASASVDDVTQAIRDLVRITLGLGPHEPAHG